MAPKAFRRFRRKKNQAARPPPSQRFARSLSHHSEGVADLMEKRGEEIAEEDQKIDFMRLGSTSTLMDVNKSLHEKYPDENAFMYISLSSLVKQALLFRHYLPRVQPFYGKSYVVSNSSKMNSNQVQS